MDVSTIVERLFKTLANERQYVISDEEIALYIKHLMPHGLRMIGEAAMVFTCESTINDNVFPSIAEFERMIMKIKKVTDSSLSP